MLLTLPGKPWIRGLPRHSGSRHSGSPGLQRLRGLSRIPRIPKTPELPGLPGLAGFPGLQRLLAIRAPKSHSKDP